MGSDYHYEKVAKTENGIPFDQWGHALDASDVRGKGKKREARDLTSPYGSLQYAIGTGDDFHCFDYALLPDGRVALHSVINSETGSFIMDGDYQIVAKSEAVRAAMGMVGQACDWCCDNDIRHDRKGWNQDMYFFVRGVISAVQETEPVEFKNPRKGGYRSIAKYLK